MTWATALSVFLVPIPIALWALASQLADELPKSWKMARTVVLWAIRLVAFVFQVLCLTVAQNIAKTFAAPSQLIQVLDALVLVGTVGVWVFGVGFLLLMGYSALKWIRDKLVEAGHVLKGT